MFVVMFAVDVVECAPLTHFRGPGLMAAFAVGLEVW